MNCSILLGGSHSVLVPRAFRVVRGWFFGFIRINHGSHGKARQKPDLKCNAFPQNLRLTETLMVEASNGDRYGGSPPLRVFRGAHIFSVH